MKDKLFEAFNNLLFSIVDVAPKVVLGFVLILVGIAAAKLVEFLMRSALRRVQFDSFVRRTGIEDAIRRVGVRQELSVFVPHTVYYLVLVLLGQTTADALGLTAISEAIRAFFQYLPNLVAALLLVMAGSAFGQFAGNAVAQSAEESGLDMAPALGRMVSGGVFFVCAMMAISQLKIDTAIIRIVTSIILGGAALAFAISFGLGTREIVRNIAAGFYARKVLNVGRPIEILGQRGVLKAITATHLIVRTDTGDVTVSNKSLLSTITKQ